MTPDGQDRRAGNRSLEALVIQLDDNMRRDMKEHHDRLRRSIDGMSEKLDEYRTKHDADIHAIEKDVLTIVTERKVEEKLHAKQATFISILVSAIVTAGTQVLRSYLGKP